MPNRSPFKHFQPKLPVAANIVGIYLFFGCLWIFFSDRLLNHLIQAPVSTFTELQTVKGWLYVMATASLLYLLIDRETKTNQQATTRLKYALAELQSAQVALKQSEEQLRLAFDFAQIGSWDWDIPSNQIIWNANHFLLLGLDPNTTEATYENWRQRVHPDDINRIEGAIKEALQFQSTYAAEYRIIYPDGSIHWVIGRGRAIYDVSGQPARMLGVILDITKQKQIEEQLLKHFHLLEMAQQAAQMGVYEWNLVTNQAYWTPEMETLMGMKLEDQPNNLDAWFAQVYPDDQIRVQRQFDEWLHSDRLTQTGEYRFYRNGEERWLDARGYLVRDETGKALKMIGTNLDITERKRTEELLRLREQQFRQAIVNAPYPMLLHAEDGEVVQINQVWTEITGYEAEDIPTVADWTEKAYGQRMDMVRAKIDQLYSLNGKVYEGEFTLRTKDGQERIWDFSSAPIGKLPDGRRLVLSMAADITDRKQTETRLKAALVEKEVLLKEIHHRVKNNLQIISGLLQLQAEGLNDAKVIAALRESQNRIESMSLIHKKLYTSSDLGQIDVGDYIQTLATSLLTTYQVLPGRILLDVDVEPVDLSLDQAIPCGLIINEVVSNALKYAFPGNRSGEINIKLCHENDHFNLTIQDNGIGMPTNFDWNVPETLGLSLVHALATEQLEGSLSVENKDGTKVTVKFPQA